VLSLAALLVAGHLACSRGGSHPKSILLIVVDTLRAGRLGAYGHWRPTSPEIDGLARESIVFLQAFANAPWTLPSVGSLLTGLDPSRHGAGRVLRRDGKVVSIGRGKSFHGIDQSAPTLAEILSAEGYDTAAFVNNPMLSALFGFARGFDHFDWSDDTRPGSDVVRSAGEWLARERRGPFFVWVHLMDPHLPYAPAPHVRGRFTAGIAGEMQLPISDIVGLRTQAPRLSEEQRRFIRAAYDEEVASVDEQVGRLLRILDEEGLDEETLVILTSDHGEELFEHGGFEHGHAFHQEVLHVPLLIRWPGLEPRRIAQPVSLVDLLPTLCDALSLPIPETAGSSLLGLLTNGGSPSPRAILAEDTLYDSPGRALVRWPLKLILRDDAPPRLFDLASDPREEHDLLASSTPAFVRLRQELEERVTENAAARGLSPAVDLGPGMVQRLRSLGYVE
jgi:arylsulfatase A-like enzyme